MSQMLSGAVECYKARTIKFRIMWQIELCLWTHVELDVDLISVTLQAKWSSAWHFDFLSHSWLIGKKKMDTLYLCSKIMRIN